MNDDVVSPWSGPSIRRINSRFAPGRKSWTLELATPLDGQLSIALEPGSDGLELLAGDGRSVLGQSVWTGDGGRAIDFQVCGRRSFVVRARGSGASIHPADLRSLGKSRGRPGDRTTLHRGAAQVGMT